MIEYVLCYAVSMDNPDADWIVLIDKVPPEPRERGESFVEDSIRYPLEAIDGHTWMYNRINLPGGKIEAGESTIQAAVRELKEEVNLEADPEMCELIGTIHGVGWAIYTVLCPFSGPFQTDSSCCDERPVIRGLRQALSIGSNILPELRTIIPLCIAKQRWQMIVSTDRNDFHYTLQVHEQ